MMMQMTLLTDSLQQNATLLTVNISVFVQFCTITTTTWWTYSALKQQSIIDHSACASYSDLQRVVIIIHLYKIGLIKRKRT